MTYEYNKAFGGDMYTEGGIFDVASPHDLLMADQVIPPKLTADTRAVPSTLSTPAPPPALLTNGNGSPANGAPANSGDPLTTTHTTAGGATVTTHWGGIALLGFAGAFGWWVWKRFMPAMEAAGERERGMA